MQSSYGFSRKLESWKQVSGKLLIFSHHGGDDRRSLASNRILQRLLQGLLTGLESAIQVGQRSSPLPKLPRNPQQEHGEAPIDKRYKKYDRHRKNAARKRNLTKLNYSLDLDRID